jgi:transcriptional antiterminator NusG
MEKKWYVVNTYSGHENKVKANLEMRIDSMNMQDFIYRVVVPEQNEVEIKDGVKKEKLKKLFPGYILIEMVMSDESWYVVRNTPGVTGFIGSSGGGAKPIPLQPHEVDNILNKMGMQRVEVAMDIVVGDQIKLIDGAFKGMFGKVNTIDLEKQTMTVLVDLFGQETPVEVDFTQIEQV